MPATGNNIASEISIQVSLGGFSFVRSGRDGQAERSPWLGAERVFNLPELQQRYSRVDFSLLTPKVALVPEPFFAPEGARSALEQVCALDPEDKVEWVKIPAQQAVLIYSNSIGESLSRVLSQTVLDLDGNPAPVLPEMYWLLEQLPLIQEYNKIVLSWQDGWLHLVIAQGKTLQLANVFQAPDFTTAQYFLFLALKRLQLNPEVSTVCVRTPLDMESEMSLYRYFKAVVQL